MKGSHLHSVAHHAKDGSQFLHIYGANCLFDYTTRRVTKLCGHLLYFPLQRLSANQNHFFEFVLLILIFSNQLDFRR